MTEQPLRLALLGAGVYMRGTHAPVHRMLRDRLQVVAVYSRTAESAQAVAGDFDEPVDVYTDLDALLRRDDIDAVDIALPIDRIPDAIERSLAAGKHVLSEKPAAPDLAEGKRLAALAAGYPAQLWMVAENWRYEPAFQQAKALIDAGTIGDVCFAHWALAIKMDAANRYYGSDWRMQPAYQGGYLYDTGVHHTAALRILFGEIARVSAFATQVRDDLPPADTLSASLAFESGLLASYAITFAGAAPYTPYLHVVGSEGALRIDRPYLEILRGGEVERRETWDAHGRNGSTLALIEDFVAVVRGERPHERGTPAQALQDVAIMEALLRSVASGQAESVERLVEG